MQSSNSFGDELEASNWTGTLLSGAAKKSVTIGICAKNWCEGLSFLKSGPEMGDQIRDQNWVIKFLIKFENGRIVR